MGSGLLGIAVAAFCADVFLVVFGGHAGRTGAGDVLAVTAILAAGFATLLTGLGRSRERRAWAVLGAGILVYGGGWIYYLYVQKELVRFPGAADYLWLVLYPCLFVAIALLVQRRHREEGLSISLDAAIIALALGALGYELIFNGLVNIGQASAVVGGQLAYPMLDLAVLVLLILICAPSRTAVGGAWPMLALGVLILLTADTTIVRAARRRQLSTGHAARRGVAGGGDRAGARLAARHLAGADQRLAGRRSQLRGGGVLLRLLRAAPAGGAARPGPGRALPWPPRCPR